MVFKLVMQATHSPTPTSWVFILPNLEGQKAESTLSQLPGIEPQVVSTVLAAVHWFNHCATRLSDNNVEKGGRQQEQTEDQI